MGAYADSQLELSEGSDYGDKECYGCDGTGYICKLSGESFNDCHCEQEEDGGPCVKKECSECDGFGIVPKDIDDAIDEEWDAKCED